MSCRISKGRRTSKSAARYIVFASHSERDRVLVPGGCGPSRTVDGNRMLLDQVRRERAGLPRASLFGSVHRGLNLQYQRRGEVDQGPFRHVIVTARSQTKTFRTQTDSDGEFAFGRLPSGTYRISADLPAGLQIAEPILLTPPEPIDIDRDTCIEFHATTLPSGMVGGRVLLPNGYATVRRTRGALPVGDFTDSTAGNTRGVHGDGAFEFLAVPRGDYVLAFNSMNTRDPDVPYPRTFYPGVADLGEARTIHVNAGERVATTFQLPDSALPTRQLTIRLQWNQLQAKYFHPPEINVHAPGTRGPQARQVAGKENVYTVNLLLDASYTVNASALCLWTYVGRAQTPAITVDGGDASTTEVLLSFPSFPSGFGCGMR